MSDIHLMCTFQYIITCTRIVTGRLSSKIQDGLTLCQNKVKKPCTSNLHCGITYMFHQCKSLTVAGLNNNIHTCIWINCYTIAYNCTGFLPPPPPPNKLIDFPLMKRPKLNTCTCTLYINNVHMYIYASSFA